MKRYLLTIGLVLAGLVMASGQEASLEERLFDAAKRGDTAIVQRLHKQGAAVNAKDKDGFDTGFRLWPHGDSQGTH